jgi:hypothetical protein
MAFSRGLGGSLKHWILEASNISPETKKALHLCKALIFLVFLAPRPGLEPGTYGLTDRRSPCSPSVLSGLIGCVMSASSLPEAMAESFTPVRRTRAPARSLAPILDVDPLMSCLMWFRHTSLRSSEMPNWLISVDAERRRACAVDWPPSNTRAFTALVWIFRRSSSWLLAVCHLLAEMTSQPDGIPRAGLLRATDLRRADVAVRCSSSLNSASKALRFSDR